METSTNVKELVSNIRENLNQKGASAKDEVRVMRAMLNDPAYKVGVYSKEGKTGEYSPYEDSRKIVTSVLTSGGKIPSAEAKEISEKFEFGKQDAAAFVNISKEFVNTYVETGRKLPLGARETMNVSLELKHVKEADKQYPIQGANNTDGKRGTVTIPAHDTLKVSGPCPSYLRK